MRKVFGQPRYLSGLTGIVCFLPLALSAAEPARLPSTPGFEQLLKMALALVVVLAIVLVLARVLKSMRGYGVGTESLEVTGQLALGARERLLLVRVEDQRLLLGVSAAGITCLHQMGAETTTPNESASSFAEQLQQQTGISN